MECKYLFCHEKAAMRVTVPKHQKETPLCREHAEAQLKWAQPLRSRIGAVQISEMP